MTELGNPTPQSSVELANQIRTEISQELSGGAEGTLSKANFCPRCGMPCRDELFCPRCGTKLILSERKSEPQSGTDSVSEERKEEKEKRRLRLLKKILIAIMVVFMMGIIVLIVLSLIHI